MNFFSRPSSTVAGNVAKNVNASLVGAPTNVGSPNKGFAAMFGSAKGKLTELLSGKSGVLILVLFFILLFVAVIIFLVKEIRGNQYDVGKKLTSDIVKLSEMDSAMEIPGTELKPHKPGEYSYAFWLYVDGFSQTPGYGKAVFYRGERDSVQQANPIIMMDEVSNKLYFVIRTESSTLASTDSSIDYRTLKPILERNYFLNKDLQVNTPNTNKHLVLAVQSVPRQTWMHYALVIKNNIVTIYQNGEIYLVKTTNDFMRSKPTEYDQKGDEVPYNLTIDQTTGSVYVGRNSFVGGNNAVSGYLSKLEFFTYALSVNDVYNIYKKGPIPSTWLQKFGIANYGVRTPFYKLNAKA